MVQPSETAEAPTEGQLFIEHVKMAMCVYETTLIVRVTSPSSFCPHGMSPGSAAISKGVGRIMDGRASI